MSHDPHLNLLVQALRSRAGTIDHIAALSGGDRDATVAALEALAARGFVSVTNGEVTYRRPDVAVSDYARKALSAASAGLAASVDSSRDLLAELPALLQAWELGEADEHKLQVDILHGPYAAADIWRLQYSREVPLESDVMMPDTSMLFAAKPEHQSSYWSAQAGEPLRVRLLMSVESATHPAAQERIQAELDAGVQIRMHPNPPSWFWITDNETVGIPVNWGEKWPTSVMAIRSAPIAGLLSWIFNRVWNEAVPVGNPTHPWEPILALMSQGMTMEAATRVTGLTPRTGRRRIADAMAHYGAETPFALGAAWGRNR